MEPKTISWVSNTNLDHVQFKVLGGMDSGWKYYVARARYNGGLIVGKTSGNGAFVSYGGKEIHQSNRDVLSAPPDSLSWVPFDGKNLPANALRGGLDPNKQPYYIGRANHQGTLTSGKIRGTTCCIPYGGKEHYYKTYEVLVINAYRQPGMDVSRPSGRYLNFPHFSA